MLLGSVIRQRPPMDNAPLFWLLKKQSEASVIYGRELKVSFLGQVIYMMLLLSLKTCSSSRSQLNA